MDKVIGKQLSAKAPFCYNFTQRPSFSESGLYSWPGWPAGSTDRHTATEYWRVNVYWQLNTFMQHLYLLWRVISGCKCFTMIDSGSTCGWQVVIRILSSGLVIKKNTAAWNKINGTKLSALHRFVLTPRFISFLSLCFGLVQLAKNALLFYKW